jgi:hypothetical protein
MVSQGILQQFTSKFLSSNYNLSSLDYAECRYCGKEIEPKVKKHGNEYFLDRSNRIDCELFMVGKNPNECDRAGVHCTRFQTFHKRCWRLAVAFGINSYERLAEKYGW